MLRRSSQAIEKWKGFDKAIDRWLDERHHLILQLSEFAADHDFEQVSPQVTEKIHGFTSLLIDYISAGHFEFYQQLVAEGREFGDEDAVTNSRPLLEAIDISTEQALAFNEKYEDLSEVSEFADDLSSLAETLVTRFDAEDEMIARLHRAHVEQMEA